MPHSNSNNSSAVSFADEDIDTLMDEELEPTIKLQKPTGHKRFDPLDMVRTASAAKLSEPPAHIAKKSKPKVTAAKASKKVIPAKPLNGLRTVPVINGQWPHQYARGLPRTQKSIRFPDPVIERFETIAREYGIDHWAAINMALMHFEQTRPE